MNQAEHTLRAQTELQHLAAQYVSGISNRQSMITITGILLAHDEKRVTFLISVLPADEEVKALEFLTRHSDDCRAYIKEHSRLRTLPFVTFAIDEGEKKRQRIDALLS